MVRRIVLDERARKHEWRHRICDASPGEIRREIALRQRDSIDRIGGLDGQARGRAYPAPANVDRNAGATVEWPILGPQRAGYGSG